MDELTDLRKAGRAWAKAAQEERAAADRLRELTVAALKAGHRPGEVVAASGWVPAQVRKVARAAGLDRARPGPAKRTEQ